MLENLIQRITRQILSEAGFRQFNKPNSQNSTSTTHALYIKDAFFQERYSAKKNTTFNCIGVILKGVKSDRRNELVNAINNVSRQILSVNNKQSFIFQAVIETNQKYNTPMVVVYFNIDNKELLPQYINQLKTALIHLNDYTDESIDNFCNQIYNRIDAVVTPKDAEYADLVSFNNWKEMLQLLDNSDVKKRLLLYQTTNDYARTYGHILSPKNIKQILDQCPQAQFVTERSSWLKYFNRKVKPNAQRIIVTKAIPATPPNKDILNNIAQKANYKDFSDLTKDNEYYTTQVQHGINIAAQKKVKAFIKTIMYDVSDTEPIDPNNDGWLKLGLSNNINGELNAAALEYDKMHRNDSIQQQNQQAISQTQSNKWQNIKQGIKNVCWSKLGKDYIVKTEQYFKQQNKRRITFNRRQNQGKV